MAATVTATLMSALLVEVPLKVTVSAEVGQVSVVQLVQVFQLVSAPPPPSQVRAVAVAVGVMSKKEKMLARRAARTSEEVEKRAIW